MYNWNIVENGVKLKSINQPIFFSYTIGIIHMYISDELRVEGRLHSNGEIGRGTTGGAGAGGSIYVVVGHLDGAGSFETFGGSGKIRIHL